MFIEWVFFSGHAHPCKDKTSSTAYDIHFTFMFFDLFDGFSCDSTVKCDEVHAILSMKTDNINKILCSKSCQVSLIMNNTVIDRYSSDHSRAFVSQLLTEYGDQIELVLSNNDDMALGAVDAMKAAGIDQAEWPVILGIDGTDVGLAALKNGEIRGTVYNDKEGQAEKMFDLAFCLARGLPLDDLGLEDGKYIRQPYTKLEEVPEEQE